ncbi:uncharacterized protein MELLADRAFT_69320 [Melampsora larici-populina 98AG31]|uniref:Uncharacterized protein n=1 Tax=Melampsora larici-populina (strain 98AG31 / pathotype 3-4-7) TaxID=747676 RepID=F4SA98_MELLP|nr:uncharacterized protein MELLADRAFT_69320 [Melampsora larici-populina 98AG31]EGF98441.1 hypothetical protein MELLADRAFT_69320 [Melampsora larici-populina 98AG31]
MSPLRKQPQRKAKVAIKAYYDNSKISFAAGPQKYHREPMVGGIDKCPLMPYWNSDQLPDFENYLKVHVNCNHKSSTASDRNRWKREDARKRLDLHRWTQASLAIWRSKKQAEAHTNFFFLKGALADVQNYGPDWLFTPEDYKLAHKVLRSSSNAEQYYEQPEEERKQWLEEQLFEARNGHDSHSMHNLTWYKPY